MPKSGEFELIDNIRKSFADIPEGVLGIGDDCAVIPQQTGLDTLVSTDMLVEGSHFLLSDVDPWQLGWKSAAVNISDIAAMGGQPVATFLSLALPKDLPEGWIERFMKGYKSICAEYGVPLLGGDTTASPDRLCINVAILGSCAGGTARLRSAARPGDLVCVTGTLGDSAAGLKVILRGGERTPEESTLVSRHYLPRPRVKEGMSLKEANAMMDISDGVASDLRHILEESGVSAEIDAAKIPFSPEFETVCESNGWDKVELALCGGEDYELLFTVPAEAEPSLSIPHHVIGRIVPCTQKPAIKWLNAEDSDYSGFVHF